MQGDFTNERKIFLPVGGLHDAESFSLGPDALLLSYIMFLTVISLTGPGLGRSGKLRRNLKNFTTWPFHYKSGANAHCCSRCTTPILGIHHGIFTDPGKSSVHVLIRNLKRRQRKLYGGPHPRMIFPIIVMISTLMIFLRSPSPGACNLPIFVQRHFHR